MKRTTRGALVALAILFFAATSSSAQIQANGDCVQAKTWHLQQAMKLNLVREQEYHLAAADAADKLSTMGGAPCTGWKDWAMGRASISEP